MTYTEKLKICLTHNFKLGGIFSEYKRNLKLTIDCFCAFVGAVFSMPYAIIKLIFTPLTLLFYCFTLPLNKSVNDKFYKNLDLINNG